MWLLSSFGNGKPEGMAVGKSQRLTVSLLKEGMEKSKRFPCIHRTQKKKKEMWMEARGRELSLGSSFLLKHTCQMGSLHIDDST